MINDTVSKLIEVFSNKPAVEVTKNDLVEAFLADDYEEVKAIPGFAEAFNRIRKAKLKIDRIAQFYPEPENQALHCLAELNAERGRYRDPPNSYLETKMLIRNSLFQQWGDLKAEWDVRCKLIGEWSDVFISYTNRDAFATNQTYADLVLREWGREIDTTTVRSNYIAPTIAKYLQQNNLRCFYDYQNLQCGDDIEDEIRKHSSSAIALVQLIEPQIFAEPAPNEKNWCKEEFDEFSRSELPRESETESHNRYFFILARGNEIKDILPANQARYINWITTVSRKLHLTLNNYKNDFDRLRRDVGEIADNILQTRKKIIDAILSSW